MRKDIEKFPGSIDIIDPEFNRRNTQLCSKKCQFWIGRGADSVQL